MIQRRLTKSESIERKIEGVRIETTCLNAFQYCDRKPGSMMTMDEKLVMMKVVMKVKLVMQTFLPKINKQICQSNQPPFDRDGEKGLAMNVCMCVYEYSTNVQK